MQDLETRSNIELHQMTNLSQQYAREAPLLKRPQKVKK